MNHFHSLNVKCQNMFTMCGSGMEEHNIKNMRVFFCLNCYDWIKDKNAVFEQGWSMFDEAGFLWTDV